MPTESRRPLKIMISSTRKDLMQYRQVTSAVIKKLAKIHGKRLDLTEVSMEEAIQTGDREYPVALSKKWVEEADWVVVIVGWWYGTITDEDGAERIGVTQWEFRHALDCEKKTFVFLGGETEPDNYRQTDKDELNLFQAAFDASEEQRTKMKAFRQQLMTQHSGFFRNVRDFEDKLEPTLQIAIDKLLPPIRPGSSLAFLVLRLSPHFDLFMKSIDLLNRYKSLHDDLHEIRQNVIKPIRENILPSWRMNDQLGDQQRNALLGIRGELKGRYALILKRVEEIEKAKGTASDRELNRLIDTLHRLSGHLPIWDSPPDSNGEHLSHDTFNERLNAVCAVVEAAFRQANAAMLAQGKASSDLRRVLREELTRAQHSGELSDLDADVVREEVSKLEEKGERLLATLENHNRWQLTHDQIESLQGYSGTKLYLPRLQSFFDLERPGLLDLARNCLAEAKQIPAMAQPSPQIAEDLVAHLDALVKALEAWPPPFSSDDDTSFPSERQSPTEESFGPARLKFDDAFFKIDKSTLASIGESSERVEEFRGVIAKLAAPPVDTQTR